MTITRINYLTAKEGRESQMEAGLRTNVDAIGNFPGSNGVELLRDADNKRRFCFIERWANDKAYASFCEVFSKRDSSAVLDALDGPMESGSFEGLKKG